MSHMQLRRPQLGHWNPLSLIYNPLSWLGAEFLIPVLQGSPKEDRRYYPNPNPTLPREAVGNDVLTWLALGLPFTHCVFLKAFSFRPPSTADKPSIP
jgi:hypothetical protein